MEYTIYRKQESKYVQTWNIFIDIAIKVVTSLPEKVFPLYLQAETGVLKEIPFSYSSIGW